MARSASCPASWGRRLLLPYGVTAGEIDAPVVFAGFGQVDPAEKIDDFDGIDVKGRFVLVFQGERPGRRMVPNQTTRKPHHRRLGARSSARQRGG